MLCPCPSPWDAKVLVGILGASGALHLARPETYEPLMPSFVPAHREVIYGSGVAELLCAAGLLHPRTRTGRRLRQRRAARGGVPGQREDGRRRAPLAEHQVQADRLRAPAVAVADDPGGPEGRPDGLNRLTQMSGVGTRSVARLQTATLHRTVADRVLPLDSISSLVPVSHQIRPNQPLIE